MTTAEKLGYHQDNDDDTAIALFILEGASLYISDFAKNLVSLGKRFKLSEKQSKWAVKMSTWGNIPIAVLNDACYRIRGLD